MELTQNQILRCNRLMYTVVLFLCSFYIVNVGLYFKTRKMTTLILFIVTALTILIATIVYKLFKEKSGVRYALAGIFFINYSVTLFLFSDLCYYSYMFAIMLVAIFYLDKRFLNILTLATEIINAINIFVYQSKVLHLYKLVEFVYVPLMIGIMYVVFRFAIKVFTQFMRESRDAVLEKAKKNEETAQIVFDTVESINTEFKDILKELKEINIETKNNVSSMSAIADTTEDTANEITSQASMTGDIQKAIRKSTDNVNYAQQTTGEVQNIVQKGIQLVEKLTNQSQQVNTSTNQMADSTKVLGKRVNDVLDIVDVIMSISNQTNLLALNASIEAARAGEAGKGFAVVAEEIRKLSDDTKNSTQQITEIIKELSEVTKNTMKMLDSSVEGIDKQNSMIIEVDKGFTEAGTYMTKLKDVMDGIVNDVNIIDESNVTIVDSINQLSASTEQISSCAQTSAGSSEAIMNRLNAFTERINAISDKLNYLVTNI